MVLSHSGALMRKISIAVIGLGNVARSFLRFCLREGEAALPFHFAGLADRSGAVYLPEGTDFEALLKKKTAGQSLAKIFGSLAVRPVEEFLDSAPSRSVDVVLESLPTLLESAQPALNFVLKALSVRIPVVTVDKGPLIHNFNAVIEAAKAAGVGLEFNGTTGVASPEGWNGAEVVEISGVLNGTTNFLLSAMAAGEQDFDRLIQTAQEAGIAEPDPSFDIDGWDAACKILILASKWMGCRDGILSVDRTGIGPETWPAVRSAALQGKVLRLIARALLHDGQIVLSVRPEAQDPQSPFFDVWGTDKSAVFRTRHHGDFLVGARSGRDEIAGVICRDILRVCPPVDHS